MHGPVASLTPEFWMDQEQDLHEARLRYALGAVMNSRADSLLDIGCGSGTLLKRAVRQARFRRIVGLEVSGEALAVARRELRDHLHGGEPLELIQGSCLDDPQRLAGFDAAALVETIEHLDPRHLSRLETNLFAHACPGTIVVTTPNREYNVLYGLHQDERRDPDHRFEWDRRRFGAWAHRLARQHGYQVCISGIGEAHPEFGCPTQAARFTRRLVDNAVA